MFGLRGLLALGAVVGWAALATTVPALAAPKENNARKPAEAIKKDVKKGAEAIKKDVRKDVGKVVRAVRAGAGKTVHGMAHGRQGAQHRRFAVGVVVKIHNPKGGKGGRTLTVQTGSQHRQREAGAVRGRHHHHHHGHETFGVDVDTRFARLRNAGTGGQTSQPIGFQDVNVGDTVKITRGPDGVSVAVNVDVLEGGRHHRHHHRHPLAGGNGGGGNGGGPGGVGGGGGNGAGGGAGGPGGVGGVAGNGGGNGVNVNVGVNGPRLRKVPLRHPLLALRRAVERREARGQAQPNRAAQVRRAVARHALADARKIARVVRNQVAPRVARLVDHRQAGNGGKPGAHPARPVANAVKAVARDVRHDVAKHTAPAAHAGTHNAGHAAPQHAAHQAAHHAPAPQHAAHAPAHHATTAHAAASGHKKR